MQINRLILSLSVGLFISAEASALQVIEGVEGKPFFVKASIRDLNLISIEGGKVRLIKAADDSMLTGSADSVTGQAMIKPLVKDSFGILVLSQSGRTYSLVLQPQDIPSESIVIREHLPDPLPKNTVVDRPANYEMQIKTMIQAMAARTVPSGLQEKKTWQEVKLWQGATFALERTIYSQFYLGEQYKLINNSDKTIVIAEQEFFVDGVLAVAVADLTIEPGKSTLVYLVKRNEGVR